MNYRLFEQGKKAIEQSVNEIIIFFGHLLWLIFE